MSEMKNDKLSIETLQEIPVGWWVKWGRPYLFSFIWLMFVMLFAYLSIAVDYLFSEEILPFFNVYSKMQSNYVACIANLGFFFFAGVDYWQTHHHYQKNELQGWIVIVAIVSIIVTILLPLVLIIINDHNGTICIRGNHYPITWVCYVMHIYFIISLFLLRSETQKVRSIEKYTMTFKTNQYIIK